MKANTTMNSENVGFFLQYTGRARGSRHFSRRLIRFLLLSAGSAFLALCSGNNNGTAANPLERKTSIDQHGPVVLELFTSQGCSSCPPADALLARLRKEGQIDGREVIVLSHHVDYWNRLGWKDPYSSKTASERQEFYAERLGLRGIYTPQMVIDGRFETVGHSEARIRNYIRQPSDPRQQSGQSEINIQIELNRKMPLVVVTLNEPLTSEESLQLALVQDGLSNSVPRGENANRRLSHDGVVHDFWHLDTAETVEPTATGAPPQTADVSVRYTKRLEPDYGTGNFRLVVLRQQSDGAIVAARQIDFKPLKLR